MSNSWSGLTKELEQDYICEKLKGRIQYFMTHYHRAPDNYGRFCIRVDNKEYIKTNPYTYDVKGYTDMEGRIKWENNIPMREWTGKETLYDNENQDVEDKVRDIAINNGDFDIYYITDAIREYKSSSIEESISSKNPIVRMFAIIDRRIGKRTLKKLADQVDKQPEWLQFFYQLRMDAENICYQRIQG